MTSNAVGRTILEQLGGGRFIAMTGAKNILAGGSELQFHLPARFAKDGINAVRVELTPADVYRVQFFTIAKRGLAVKVVAEFDGVYADDLQAVFTRTTGLDTRI